MKKMLLCAVWMAILTVTHWQTACCQLPWPVTPTNQIKRLFAGYGTYDDFTVPNAALHLHEGLDIRVDSGTYVIASEAGKVVFTRAGAGYSSCVFVSRGANLNEALCYIHIDVGNNPAKGRVWTKNDDVKAGDTIGTVTKYKPAKPGDDTIAVHLHFDWRRKLAAEDWVFFYGAKFNGRSACKQLFAGV